MSYIILVRVALCRVGAGKVNYLVADIRQREATSKPQFQLNQTYVLDIVRYAMFALCRI